MSVADLKGTITEEYDHPAAPFLIPPPGTSRNSERELRESVIYAKRIQEGMMLKEKHLERLFPSSFLLFRPRDIVSGDFYWFTRIDDTILIAAADCTGHGIPGAFMSVLGISLLNQIIIEEQQTDPSAALQRLDHKLRKAFSYSTDLHDPSQHADGMDIALAAIHPATSTIHVASAMRTSFFYSRGELTELRGSNTSIGGHPGPSASVFPATTVRYKPGDRLFLFSDGFQDQFGGPSNKKFLRSRFREIVARTSRQSMSTQHLELLRTFHEWKGHEDQTDDVLVIGLSLL